MGVCITLSQNNEHLDEIGKIEISACVHNPCSYLSRSVRIAQVPKWEFLIVPKNTVSAREVCTIFHLFYPVSGGTLHWLLLFFAGINWYDTSRQLFCPFVFHCHCQVQSDLNFDFVIGFLASFSHDLPRPLEVKVCPVGHPLGQTLWLWFITISGFWIALIFSDQWSI